MAPVIFDIERVCRLCIREDDGQSKMTSIFEQPDLEDIIKNCVQIEISLGSDEPTNICPSCMLSLDSWSKFKMLCDTTNEFLQNYLQDNNESDLVLNSEMTNLGTLGFTPSQMSDFSVNFLESDTLWNNITTMSQQSNEVDPTYTESPIPRCTKKLQPPKDLIIDTTSSEECMDTAFSVLRKKDDSCSITKPYSWNPKAISMKAIEKEKLDLKKGPSRSLYYYKKYFRKTFVCTVCSETFTKFNDLILHESTVHSDIPKKFNCKTCGKLFVSQENLDIHEIVHREKLFQCKLCEKKFTNKKTLGSHMNIHIGLYTCQKCDYKAPTLYNLNMHAMIHSSVKDHCCKDCNKTFATLSSLRRHDRLVHKKLFVFQCDLCDFSTIQPSNFKYHKSTHTPQSIVCDYCGSCFKNQGLFEKHLNRHKDAQFSCTHCDKHFKRKSILKEHLSRIHGLGPNYNKYKCDVCEQNFSKDKHLRKHKANCSSNPIIV
ncbi:Hypothetical protein CINCED_3A000939 [Cinara cedri]|uniref:Uncharacterized protein n=1 Tax=Cinara cedri TaxID=506608 RepID=A0A5E4M6X2_9HEMI|nr:Hypothetical protein CINCED_3A000939 [Cinara cedri]